MSSSGPSLGDFWEGVKETVKPTVGKVAVAAAAPAVAAHAATYKVASSAFESAEKRKMGEIKSMMPTMPKLPDAPKVAQPMQVARNMEAARAKRYGGTGSTILTGALGVPGGAVTQRKALLGQ